jgi:predicted dehydrogenase
MKNRINRRNFIGMIGSTVGATCLSPRFAFAGLPDSTRKLRVGVVGGGFGRSFYFNEHPNCTVEAVSDLIPERRQLLMDTYQCKKSYESLEILLRDPKIEAVAIFTGAPDHARHVIQTLNAGKHVLSAVPAVMSLQEAYDVFETVKRTGLTYMMAETSAYFQTVISAKKFYKEGLFGNIFSSAGQYYHPGLEELYFTNDGKITWRHGLPPMLYPTHVTAHIVAVTGERLTSVSCNGWGDDNPILKNNR